jgi:hypothetical protein
LKCKKKFTRRDWIKTRKRESREIHAYVYVDWRDRKKEIATKAYGNHGRSSSNKARRGKKQERNRVTMVYKCSYMPTVEGNCRERARKKKFPHPLMRSDQLQSGHFEYSEKGRVFGKLIPFDSGSPVVIVGFLLSCSSERPHVVFGHTPEQKKQSGKYGVFC